MDESTQASSDFNPVTGLENVGDEMFLPEEHAESETESTETETQSESDVTNQESSETTEESKQAEETPLLAGKYKDETALREAFANLGGNPSEYSDVKQLEEAYKVRDREFTRSRQQLAELDRLNKPEEQADESKNDLNDVFEQVSKQIDFDKIDGPKALFTETIKAVDQLYQLRSQKERENLIQQITTALETRENSHKELTEVETEVPRLKTDTEFREAFADYISGQKAMGRYQGLKASMKSFLAIGQKITEEVSKQREVEEKAKASAASTNLSAEGQATTSKKDEADQIIDAFSARKSLFG